MSEYFRAATNCDIDTAKLAPLPVDLVEVRRQQFMHEKLVSQAIQTQLLLLKDGPAVDKKFPGLVQSAGKVPPEYEPPGGVNLKVDPSLRRPGAHQLQKALEARVAKAEELAKKEMENVLEQEMMEQALRHKRKEVEASQNARRAAAASLVPGQAAVAIMSDEAGVSASVAAGLQAAFAPKEEVIVDPLVKESFARKTLHPVDVLHQRVAAEIRRELSEFEHRQVRTFMATRLRNQVANGELGSDGYMKS